MKNLALTLAAALAALTSTAAFIPQANQAWVTNKIDEVVGTNTAARIAAVAQAATNYTDYVVAAAGGVTPLVVTNIAGAVVSKSIVKGIQTNLIAGATMPPWLTTDEGRVPGQIGTVVEYFENRKYYKWGVDYASKAAHAKEAEAADISYKLRNGGVGPYPWTLEFDGGVFQDCGGRLLAVRRDPLSGAALGSITNAWITDIATWARSGMEPPVSVETDPTVPAWAKAANPPATYTDAQAGAVATNVVRSINGGVWDAALQVWWTPVMSNGKLTYQATTNVNLNAGN